jgi:hypothetical protein
LELGEGVAPVDVCESSSAEAPIGEDVIAAAAAVASLNCHPLKGTPSTLVVAVAVMEVLSQPADPPKSLAYSKT